MSKSFLINCDSEAETLLPFFKNVVSILSAQIEASKARRPRRKMQKRQDVSKDQERFGGGDLSTATTERGSRKRGLKLVQKTDRRQTIAPYPKRKSLLPYFNITTSQSNASPDPVPAPVRNPAPTPAPVRNLVPVGSNGSNVIHGSHAAISLPNVSSYHSPTSMGNQQSGDIFSIIRNNLNVILNGEFATQDVQNEATQTDQEAENRSSSAMDIFDCLSNRMYNGWNDSPSH